MKLLTVVGARPQFVKASVVSRAINLFNQTNSNKIEESILHTGQHFDANMSDAFFTELDIPSPKINLGIHSTSHADMTAQMMLGIEQAIQSEVPDALLVYGDTNSTLAAALVASKLNIAIAHVEAGLRSYNRKMPEEINRVLTDHVSKHLYCPTVNAVNNLSNEGITAGVFNTGDVMLDAFEYATQRTLANQAIAHKAPQNLKNFALVTIHRPSNTDSSATLCQLLSYLNDLSDKIDVVMPLHPRTKAKITSNGLQHLLKKLIVCEPVSYFEMVSLLNRCDLVITDSGGLQKEAYFAKKPCLTLREETEWVETLENNCNQLCGTNPLTIEQAMSSISATRNWQDHYGQGNAGQEIVTALANIS